MAVNITGKPVNVTGTFRLIRRWMSTANRPIAALEETVEEEIDSGKVGFRKHHGVFNRGVIRVPDDLKKAVDRVISESSVGNLLKNAKQLNNHLTRKKPPLTHVELEDMKRECYEKIVADNPIPDLNYLTAEDHKRVVQSLETKSKNYFQQKAYNWRPVEYSQGMALIYLAARMAPDYASLHFILNELTQRDPHFKPQSVLDFGSGVGTTLWAVKSCWNSETIQEAFCVDSSIHMNTLALALARGGVWPQDVVDSDAEAQKGLYFRQFLPASAEIKYDLTVCAHSLLELPSAELRLQTALTLWRKTRDYLIFVEHGSRAAFEVLMEVRDFLISLSKGNNKEPGLVGHVFSPCPQDFRCPRLADSTPCNFMVTYEPLLAKQASRGLAQEKFSYVVFKKGARPDTDLQWPRVVRPVLDRSRHTICRLCTDKGKLEEVVISRGKNNLNTNRCARSTNWGDLLPVKLSPARTKPVDETTVSEEIEAK